MVKEKKMIKFLVCGALSISITFASVAMQDKKGKKRSASEALEQRYTELKNLFDEVDKDQLAIEPERKRIRISGGGSFVREIKAMTKAIDVEKSKKDGSLYEATPAKATVITGRKTNYFPIGDEIALSNAVEQGDVNTVKNLLREKETLRLHPLGSILHRVTVNGPLQFPFSNQQVWNNYRGSGYVAGKPLKKDKVKKMAIKLAADQNVKSSKLIGLLSLK